MGRLASPPGTMNLISQKFKKPNWNAARYISELNAHTFLRSLVSGSVNANLKTGNVVP